MWVATSDNVPGLVAEAESLDALPKIPASPIPELLQANGRIEHVAGVFEEIGRAAQQSIAGLDRNRYTQAGDPRPFRWTKSADDILDTIKRFCLRTLNTPQRQTEIIRTSESGH